MRHPYRRSRAPRLLASTSRPRCSHSRMKSSSNPPLRLRVTTDTTLTEQMSSASAGSGHAHGRTCGVEIGRRGVIQASKGGVRDHAQRTFRRSSQGDSLAPTMIVEIHELPGMSPIQGDDRAGAAFHLMRPEHPIASALSPRVDIRSRRRGARRRTGLEFFAAGVPSTLRQSLLRHATRSSP